MSTFKPVQDRRMEANSQRIVEQMQDYNEHFATVQSVTGKVQLVNRFRGDDKDTYVAATELHEMGWRYGLSDEYGMGLHSPDEQVGVNFMLIPY